MAWVISVLVTLKDCVAQLGFDKTYWVAFSGGMDSHVLLMLCHELRQTYPLKLNAIYINHGLNLCASEWAAHCKQVCESNQINFIERTVKVDTTDGSSMEAVAREQRYGVFAEYIDKNNVLLTAHHQDDQAETVLLQLARGAGLKGLAAMPMVKPFAGGQHARPLLAFSRVQVERFATEHQLQWVEDDSNTNTSMLRNFVRHDVIPLLKDRWPAMAATFSRSATHCAEAQVLLEEYAAEDCIKAVGSRERTLSIQTLLLFSPARVRQVLRMWIQSLGFPLPDTKKIAAIQQDVFSAAWDRSPCVEWEGAELRRYRDDLFLLTPVLAIDEGQTVVWSLSEPLVLPGIGTLCATPVKGQGLKAELQYVSVRFRRGGESLCLPKRGRHTLKNLFQEWGVLPWLRDRIPLLYVDDQLAGVAGYRLGEAFSVQADEMGWEIGFTAF